MAGGGNEEGEFGLQIAPMLDVMFVLLLFFMVSAGAVMKESELGVNIPGQSTKAPEGIPVLPIILDISKEGAVKFNNLAMDTPDSKDLPTLRAKLKSSVDLEPKQSVLIRPAAEVQHERLVDVLNACSWARVSQLSFAGN